MDLKNKKCEMTNEQLIKLIVLVVSFAIILIFWYFFAWKSQITQETCHTSVILKKTVPTIAGSKVVDVPLKCQTEKICITSGLNEKCPLLGSQYTKVSVNSEEEIIREIADNMVACWSMMGEGKEPAVFSKEFLEPGLVNKGVICSIIGFSEETKKQFSKIGSAKIHQYMNTHKAPGKDVNYWQYLLGINLENANVFISNDALNGGFIDTSEPYSIIFVEQRMGALSNILAIGSTELFLGAVLPIKSAPTLILTTGLLSGGFVGGLMDKYQQWLGIQDSASAILVVPFKSSELSRLNIDSFENLA